MASKNLNIIFMSAALLFSWSHAFASLKERSERSAPIELALFPPVQFPSEDVYVKGIRVSGIMGSNRKAAGIDLAVVGNRTEQDFKGLAVAGIFNWNSGTSKIVGLQAAGLYNHNAGDGRIYGLQIALLGNRSKFMDLYGVQIGLYNRAREVYGLQIGLINHAANLHGLQIGLANFNDGGSFGVSPIINFGW